MMLFVVMLGGKHPKAKIEVHDVVFAAADSLEATYPQLRESWFGSSTGLHIDAWMAVDGIEDWKVELSPLAPKPGSPRLFFLNLGGTNLELLAKLTTTYLWWLATGVRRLLKASCRCCRIGRKLILMSCLTLTIAYQLTR